MNNIRIYNVNWTSREAGPSPDDNKRTEIFLSGCKRAYEGNPCEDCFNPDLWDANRFVANISPENAFNNIEKYAPNHYITFVGGEPLDQLPALVELCKLLKEKNYHIIVFTNHKLQSLVNLKDNKDSIVKLIKNIDILIDGEYDKNNRIYNNIDYEDGFYNSIGSGNQGIWDVRDKKLVDGKYIIPGYFAEELNGIYVSKNNNDLKYILKVKSDFDYGVGVEYKLTIDALIPPVETCLKVV